MNSFCSKLSLCLLVFLTQNLVVHSMDEEGPGLRPSPDREVENAAHEFVAQRPSLFGEKLTLLHSAPSKLESQFHNPPMFNSKGDYFGNLDDSKEKLSASEIERILETFSQMPDIRKLIACMECLDSSRHRSSMQVVLEGPPGTGKTTLSKALAAQAGLKYKFVDAEQLFTTYKNSSSDGLHREIEPILAQSNPCILIIDEFTRLTEDYDRDHNQDTKTATTLWRLLDRCRAHSKIFFIGLTNDKNNMPEALKSRLQLVFHVGLADIATRKIILKNMFKNDEKITFEIENNDSYISFLAQVTDKASLRDLDILMDKILYEAGNSLYVTKQHVDAVLDRMGYLRNPIIVKGEKVFEFIKDLAKQSAPYVIPWALNTIVQVFLQKQSFEQQASLALLSYDLSLRQIELNNDVKAIESLSNRLKDGQIGLEEKSKILSMMNVDLEESGNLLSNLEIKS